MKTGGQCSTGFKKKIDVNARNLVKSTHDRDYWRALVNAALSVWVL